MSRKRARSPPIPAISSPMQEDGGAALQDMLQWLRAKGASGIDDLEYRASSEPGGGMGVFTKKPIAPGGSVAKIPQCCVLTAQKALSSVLGTACVAVNPYCTDEFVFTLWVAAGRLDAKHPFHAYLRSLPGDCASPLSWPQYLIEGKSHLGGTNLGGAIVSHNELVRGEYAGLLQRLQREKPGLLPPGCDINVVAWAHDMYVSRRFPSRLAGSVTGAVEVEAEAKEEEPPRVFQGSCSKLTESLGVMLPLFDLLNHQPGTNIDWSGDALGVTFSCGHDLSQSLPAGAEVFNNYGNKGNESLMIAHGFCTHDNLYDSYGLKLLMCTNSIADDANSAVPGVADIGVFRIHRHDNPEVLESYEEQIPARLWRAISDPMGYLVNFAAVSSDDDDDDENEAMQISIEPEDVDLLLATVQKHLAPYALTKREDTKNSIGISSKHLSEAEALEKMREVFVARYRDGQRKVLECCVVKLQEMLADIEDAEEEEEEGEGI